MHRFGLKALFTVFYLGRGRRTRIDRERIVLIFSTAVTVGLVVLYFLGKATSRW